MLKNTFLHFQGIGETSERKIWSLGIRDWEGYLLAHREGRLAGRKIDGLVEEVTDSLQRYADEDWMAFDRTLPSQHKWRGFGDFKDRALYVDIETTGLMGDDIITVIGTFDGKECRSFVKGQNLEDAVAVLESYPLVVTFNGAQFDMPIIRAHFPGHHFNHIHVDLRYPLKNLGFKGGLKKIEHDMGIARSERTTGLDGWAAVRLWHDYLDGSQDALETLLEYNREDIRNLEPLMNFAFEQLSSRTDLAQKSRDMS
ncbi:MAG: ribonuclease H-like domain-containing protein [Syntrophobacteraceae bacterium]|nr:ribonuclease H-like domain-containing protein [Syntrophobacteraceae bacterium]